MSLNFSKLKPGERLSNVSYFEVVSVSPKTETVTVRDANGTELDIVGKDFIEKSLKSSSQFEKTEKLGKNDLAEKLFTSGDTVMTVEFVKQDNTPRTLVGYFVSQDTNLGRSNFIDLNVTSGHAVRQVDHRTIKSVIVNNVKYVAR
jgi:hypothetical protein